MKTRMLRCLALPLIAAVLASCGKREAVSEADAEGDDVRDSQGMTICLLPKVKGIAYFTSCYEGAKQAAAELDGVELIYDGPTDASAEKQAAMIEKWTLQEVDAIAVSPNAPDVVAKAMKEARDAGVRVITWDADGVPDCREFFVNQATAEAIGGGLVDTMMKDLGGTDAEAELAIVSAGPAAANQNEWIKYMQERIKAYPNAKIVAIKYPGENQNVAFQDAQDLMKAHPNLKGIFGISSVSFPGAAEAVKQAGKSGKVLVTGLSTPNDMKPYVKDGTVKSVVLWNTGDLGYLTVRVAAALVNDDLTGGATSFSAGRLGKKTIAGDNVLLGDILVFTKENIDRFDF